MEGWREMAGCHKEAVGGIEGRSEGLGGQEADREGWLATIGRRGAGEGPGGQEAEWEVLGRWRRGVRGQVARRQNGRWQAANSRRRGRWRGGVRCQVTRRQNGRMGGVGKVEKRSEGSEGQDAEWEVAGCH